MTDIPLDLIRPNPFRDFELHPIDGAQVEKLRASIESNERLWPGVVARPAGNGYELAFGHHRIEAARLARMTTVPIDVCDLSNEMMALMLASENATQRGVTAAAGLDAVAALSRAVTESCLRCDTPEGVCQIWHTLSPDAAESIWGKARKGEEPGRVALQSLLPAYTQHQIDLALHVLRESGRLGGGEVIFDARCAHLFRLDYHLATFRKFATGDTVRSYLPVANQLDFASHVMEHLNGLHHINEITADMIRTACWERMENALGIPKNKLKEAPDRPSLDQIKEGLNRIRRALSDFAKGTDLLTQASDEGDTLNDAQMAQLDGMVGAFLGNMEELKGLKTPKLKLVGRKLC